MNTNSLLSKKMNMKYILVAIVLCCFSTYIMHAQSLEHNKTDITLSVGALLPASNVQGSYESDFPDDETVDIKNSVCPLMKVAFDYNILPSFSIGANINYASFVIEDILYEDESIKDGNEVNLGIWDGREHVIPLDDIRMLELNTSFKGRLILNDNMLIKPSLYIGYRKTFSSSIDAEEKGVVLNYNIEYLYYFTGQFCLLADIGFFSQPYGGVDHVGYVRAFGVPYFTIGGGFSL